MRQEILIISRKYVVIKDSVYVCALVYMYAIQYVCICVYEYLCIRMLLCTWPTCVRDVVTIKNV